MEKKLLHLKRKNQTILFLLLSIGIKISIIGKVDLKPNLSQKL